MLPLGLLTAAQGQPILVELKTGETINGHLIECDTWMNLTMKEVIHTSPDGDEFMRLSEIYVKGNNIKYLRIPEEVLDMAQEEAVPHQEHDQAESHGDGGQQQHEYGQQEHDHDQQNTRGDREGRGGRGGGGGYGYGSGGSRAGRGGRGGAV